MNNFTFKGYQSGIMPTIKYPMNQPADWIAYAPLAASGNTTLKTPPTGYAFRLMGWEITVTASATLSSPGNLVVTFVDGSSGDIWATTLSLGTTGSGIGVVPVSRIELNGGYISQVENNALIVNLSQALTAGALNVTAFGLYEQIALL